MNWKWHRYRNAKRKKYGFFTRTLILGIEIVTCASIIRVLATSKVNEADIDISIEMNPVLT